MVVTTADDAATAGGPDFDAIVVGAGVAGCVAAHQLARAGHQVALIERGESPGAKNLSGGVLYGRVLDEVFPGFAAEAPVERRVTRHRFQFLNAASAVALDYADGRLAGPDGAVTVLRARLDPWLAERCEDAGVALLPGIRVDGVLRAGGRVVGVRSCDDELRSRVVVAADGANSFLARDAGLRPAQDPPRHLGLGVKAVLMLPRDVLEARFQLSGDEGVAHTLVGDCTRGVAGGGFLYTNLDSLSVGVVLRLDDLVRTGQAASDVFEHFTGHPLVAPLLADAEPLEYGAHLVPEGGLPGMGPLVTDGMVVVGDAAGLALNTGLTVRGMDLAAQSALSAGRAVSAALAASDTSSAALDAYRVDFLSSVAGRDLRTYARTPAFLRRDRLYTRYGPLLADVLHGVLHHDGTPRRRLATVARDALRRSPLRLRDVLSDAIAGVRAL